jgi:hypothetical protein
MPEPTPELTPIEQARLHLKACLDCELAILQGAQQYMLQTPNGSQQIMRADLGKVQEQIRFWQRQIVLLSKRKGTNGKYSLARFN